MTPEEHWKQFEATGMAHEFSLQTIAMGSFRSGYDAGVKAERARVRRETRTKLVRENESLRHIIMEIWWLARRYADGRQTYATSMYNDAIRLAVKLGLNIKPDPIADTIFARDGGGRSFDGLAPHEIGIDDPAQPRETIAAAPAVAPKCCVWTYDRGHEAWRASCGYSLDNSECGCDEIKVCPGCGRKTTTAPSQS